MSSLSSDSSTSTSSYSTSSSYENISTVENGELCTFTFITPLTPASGSRVFSCACSKNGEFLNGKSRDVSLLTDPFRLDDPHSFHCKYHHQRVLEEKMCSSCRESKIQSLKSNHLLYSDNNYIQQLPRSGEGLLLRSLEKGVLFPIIHWSTKSNENQTHHNHTQFTSNTAFNQGVYKEIKRVIPPDFWLQRDLDPNLNFFSSTSTSPTNCSSPFSNSSFSSLGQMSRNSAWLLIGYKSFDKNLDSSLEATWKEWTGIRHVYLHLRSDFEVRRISFLHRVHPEDNLDLFMYVVLMEIGNVKERNRIWLMDFVQRMRVERMKGFCTVYSPVAEEIASVDEEFKKISREILEINPHISPMDSLRVVTNYSPEPFPRYPLIETSIGLSHEKKDGKNEIETSMALLDFHTSEINGNLEFMERLLDEIKQQPLGDYI